MNKTLADLLIEMSDEFYKFKRKRSDELEALKAQIAQQAADGDNAEAAALKMRVDEMEQKFNTPISVGAGNGKANGAPLIFTDREGREIKCLSGGQKANTASTPNILGRTIRSFITGKRDDFDEKSQVIGVDSSGGYALAPPATLQAIDLARAASVVSQAGAQTLVLPEGANSGMALKVTADPTVAWVPERGTITPSDATFGGVKIETRKAAILVYASREFLEYGINGPQLLEETIRQAMAAEIDRVALLGTGGDNEPVGLNTYAGVGEITSVGDVAYDDVLNAMKTVRNANHEPTGAIWSPATDYELAILKDTNDGQYLNPPRGYSELPKFITTKATDALAFVGDWSKLYWAVGAGGMRLETSIHDRFVNDEVGIRLIFNLDIFLTHPAAFCVLRGLS